MAKRDMKKALGASLKAEEQAVQSRFERADTILRKRAADAPATQLNSNSKVIRDSFTIPEAEYRLIKEIKKRCMKAGISANKSEVLRAGLAVLNEMRDEELSGVFERLQRVKTGRPATK